jgi:hypothetical protein
MQTVGGAPAAPVAAVGCMLCCVPLARSIRGVAWRCAKRDPYVDRQDRISANVPYTVVDIDYSAALATLQIHVLDEESGAVKVPDLTESADV